MYVRIYVLKIHFEVNISTFTIFTMWFYEKNIGIVADILLTNFGMKNNNQISLTCQQQAHVDIACPSFWMIEAVCVRISWCRKLCYLHYVQWVQTKMSMDYWFQLRLKRTIYMSFMQYFLHSSTFWWNIY